MRLRSRARGVGVVSGALLAASLFASGCFVRPYQVTRVVHGRRVPGPFVRAEAYAAYLRGAMLEAEGRPREAIAAYEEVLRYDPESPDPWTRIGASLCALGDPNPWAAFDRATKLDPTYDAAWSERARCHLSREELASAREAARQAVTLEPLVIDNTLLYAQTLERSGEAAEAMRWLDALVALHPDSVEAHRTRWELARRAGDRARERASAERLAMLAPDVVASSALDRIDEALDRRDLEAARRWALSARVSGGWLALRAIELGQIEEAKAQAELVAAVDPTDADARVALAWLALLRGDEAAMQDALSDLPEEAAPLSGLGARMLGELVARRVGYAMDGADAGVAVSR